MFNCLNDYGDVTLTYKSNKSRPNYDCVPVLLVQGFDWQSWNVQMVYHERQMQCPPLIV